jgi:type IV secretion system protein VirD4
MPEWVRSALPYWKGASIGAVVSAALALILFLVSLLGFESISFHRSDWLAFLFFVPFAIGFGIQVQFKDLRGNEGFWVSKVLEVLKASSFAAAIASQPRAVSYIGSVIGWAILGIIWFVSLVTWLSTDPLDGPTLFFAAFCGSIGGAFGGFIEVAKRRGEFLGLQAITWTVVYSVVSMVLFAMAVGIWRSAHGVDPPFPLLREQTVDVVGLGLACGILIGYPRRARENSLLQNVAGLSDRIAGLGQRTWQFAKGLAAITFGGLALRFVSIYWSHASSSSSFGLFELIVIGASLAGLFYIGKGFRLVVGSLAAGSRLKDDSHGRARTAIENELRKARLIPRNGNIYLGRFLNGGRATQDVGYPGRIHLITIGPNGSGKGMGLIVPNLVDQRRSILITDPKGEAAAMTARLRAKMGRVVIINPFNLFVDERPYMRSHGFNPLDVLDPKSPDFVDDAVGLAEALVRVESKEPHWAESAQDLVAALIMHECLTRGRNASLTNVRRQLTEPFMVLGDKPIGLAKTIIEMSESGYIPLKSKAGRFLSGNKEMQGIISAAITQTRFIDSPPIAADLTRGKFDFADMKREIVTVYLILPAKRLTSQSNWLRLMVQSALTALQTTPGATLPPPIFLLDEFAQLGYLPSIENAMGMLRGYGVQLWPILQDLNQLKTLYSNRWQSFIGNRGALTAFAPHDLFTAEYLSKLCGQKTEIVESENEREGQANRGRSWGPQGLPLFRPEDLMKMPKGQMLCIEDSVENPFFTQAPGYWETSFNRGVDSNPYHPG